MFFLTLFISSFINHTTTETTQSVTYPCHKQFNDGNTRTRNKLTKKKRTVSSRLTHAQTVAGVTAGGRLSW